MAFNQLVVGSNPTRPTISKIWKAHENEDFRIFFCFADCAVWIAALSLLHRVAAVTFKAYGKFFETEVSRLRRSVVLKSGDGLCRMAELDIGLNVFSEAWLVLLCAVAWRPPPCQADTEFVRRSCPKRLKAAGWQKSSQCSAKRRLRWCKCKRALRLIDKSEYPLTRYAVFIQVGQVGYSAGAGKARY
ncbi:hypothetical protein RYA99_05050 [Pseudomonas syringae pv. actinidifoliorum]|nr:hypothetical protein [Pseudomonas syringae pv. actinidifoliorum]MDU8519323.1 hypothetical protein [Pseudomonas syringae pv. actinidifoliorum]MDU8525537.1 hypothetical protein [Pseudomonas syringae pv. actinidifoliorum]